jgi:hypothetical protein
MGFRTATTFRRRLAATSLVLAPVLMIAGLVAAPWEAETGSAGYLAAVAGDPTRAQLSALLLHFGYLLLVPCVWALAHLLRSRAVVLGNVGLLVGTLGAIGNSGVVLNDYADVMLVEKLPQAQAVELYDHGQSLWGFVVAAIAGFPLLVLGLALLFLGLWRAGVLPLWALGAVPAGIAAGSALEGAGGAVLTFGGVCALLVLLGVWVAGSRDEDWELGELTRPGAPHVVAD